MSTIRQAGHTWGWALVAVTAIWGWTFVGIHDALAYIPVSTFVAYRFLGASLVVLVVLLRRVHRLTKRELLGGMGAGTVLFTGFAFQTAGLGTTTPSNAGFITGMAVVFTPLLGFLLLRELPLRRHIISALLAAIGLGLLTVRSLSVHSGDLLILCCALAFALHVVILSKVSPGADAGRLTLVQLVTAGLLGLCWAASADKLALPQQNQDVWIALGVAAVAASAIAYFVQTKAQATISPNRIAVILTMEPVFGGLFGYWLAGDRLTVINLVGAGLILISMLAAEIEWAAKSAPALE